MPIYKKLQSIVGKVDRNTGYDMEFDKPYLILLTPPGIEDEVGESHTGEWTTLKGRKPVYDYLRNCLDGYVVLKSYILSGGITFGNEVSVYTFMRLCIERFQYDTLDALDWLNDIAISTADNPEAVNEAMLDRLYNSELTSNPKG